MFQIGCPNGVLIIFFSTQPTLHMSHHPLIGSEDDVWAACLARCCPLWRHFFEVLRCMWRPRLQWIPRKPPTDAADDPDPLRNGMAPASLLLWVPDGGPRPGTHWWNTPKLVWRVSGLDKRHPLATRADWVCFGRAAAFVAGFRHNPCNASGALRTAFRPGPLLPVVGAAAAEEGEMIQLGVVGPTGGVLPDQGVTQPDWIENDPGLVPEHGIQNGSVPVVQQDDHGRVGLAANVVVDVAEGAARHPSHRR